MTSQSRREVQVQPQSTIAQVSPDVFAQIVANQTKDIETRQRELTVAEHRDEKQFTFAKQQLEAQERDRKDDRQSKDKRFLWSLIAGGVIVIVICAFFGYCISLGKDSIVTEVLKILCYGGSFGTGGFFWGRHKGKTENEK